MELIKSKTYLNLAKAFAGECMDRTRYEYIEYGARQQGHKTLADAIDKIAYNEFNHSRMLYSFIQTAKPSAIDNIEICSGYPFREKWDLIDNLRLAALDEQKEADEVYPTYAKIAHEEGFDDIAGLFENLASVEKHHQKELTSLYEQFAGGTAYKKNKTTTWTCADCGYTVEGKEAFDVCPLCQAKQGAVELCH
ncbi:MAG: rubrerythrin family protein [Clostridia bacterium]|nr:rubrerythrin family protein [Clostridia bacterium]